MLRHALTIGIALSMTTLGCGGDDAGSTAGRTSSSHADFLSSCPPIAGQCINYYGTPSATLADYASKNCGPDYAAPCPAEAALGACEQPYAGKYFPAGVTGSLIYYESSQLTPSDAQDICELGGGTWNPDYVP